VVDKIEFSSTQHLRTFLKKNLNSLYKDAIEKHDSFHIALSGGKSILIVLDVLKKMSFQWHKVHVYQVDERMVPTNSVDSNQRLLREHLCKHVNIPEENLHFVDVSQEPEVAAFCYEQTIKTLLGQHGFDAVILGLGKDCHIASLFPDGPWLKEKETMVVSVKRADLTHTRVSLSLKALSLSNTLWLLVLGHEKRDAFKLLLNPEVSPDNCPGKYLLQYSQLQVLVCFED